MRIGQGYDLHKLVEGRDLILGGVKISHTAGLLGHSDADVLTHAIIDAIFGSVADGDIGRHFPDTDPKFKGADSIELLKTAGEILKNKGYKILKGQRHFQRERLLGGGIDYDKEKKDVTRIGRGVCDFDYLGADNGLSHHLGYTELI